jgi:hypothetical protein
MALSGAERQRRYMARLKDKAVVTNGAVTDEFVRLKAFAGQLESENAALKEKLATVTNESVTDEVTKLKAENKALKEKVAAAKRREDDLVKEVSKLKNEVMQLKLDSLFVPRGAMTGAQFAVILKCLHPDIVYRLNDEVVTKQFNEAFKTFNGLRSHLVK